MFVKKKDYEKLVEDVKTNHSQLIRFLNGKLNISDLTSFDAANSRLQSRIEELEDLLIKAEILVEVQEPKADFTRKESELNSHNQRIGSKQVRYAVKKIK